MDLPQVIHVTGEPAVDGVVGEGDGKNGSMDVVSEDSVGAEEPAVLLEEGKYYTSASELEDGEPE